jgi:ribosomal protein S6
MSEETRTYELGYILVPTVPEVEVPEKVTALKTTLEAVEGIVTSEGAPEFIDLAYQIEKNVKSKKMKWNQGYFGWIKFTAGPETLETLKKSFDANLDVMRYLLIKTDAENVVTFKKPKVEAKRDSLSVDEMIFSEEELAKANEDVKEEPLDDIKEHHEKLPNVEDDIIPETPSETVEA